MLLHLAGSFVLGHNCHVTRLMCKSPCSELAETASELRLLLCREKHANGKRSANVVTACGIFVNDILEAAPIDKYFEMFKPGSGHEGGFIRLRMAIVSEEEVKTKQKGTLPPNLLDLAMLLLPRRQLQGTTLPPT